MNEATDGVPIAVVEQETGLSKDVLRKWETRYHNPIPGRDQHGDRVYSREQVARLRMVKRLMERGFRPSRLLAMSEDELAGLAAGLASARGAEDDGAAVAELLELIRKHQPMKLRTALKRQLQGQGLKSFVLDTMAPLSVAVGEAWSAGEIRVFEEHLFSDIAASTLRQALEAIDAPEGRPRILMTTLPGEAHTLGLLMAACLFALHGAHCVYLGTEMPAAEIAQAARAHAVDIVALSFSRAFPARQIAPALLGLRQQLPADIGLVAGGAGVGRQKPVPGVRYLTALADLDDYVGELRPA